MNTRELDDCSVPASGHFISLPQFATKGIIICSLAVSLAGNASAAFVGTTSNLYGAGSKDSNHFVLNFEPYDYNGITIPCVGDTIMNNAMNNNIQKLNKIASLSNNWNGYGAEEFSHRLIEMATELVRHLHHQPEIFPIAGDGIQLEYDKEDGSYLEFELSLDEDVTVFHIDEFGDEESYTIPFNIENINCVVDKFYG